MKLRTMEKNDKSFQISKHLKFEQLHCASRINYILIYFYSFDVVDCVLVASVFVNWLLLAVFHFVFHIKRQQITSLKRNNDMFGFQVPTASFVISTNQMYVAFKCNILNDKERYIFGKRTMHLGWFCFLTYSAILNAKHCKLNSVCRQLSQ